MAGGRFRELFKKYGKVALGVHFSVSAVSIGGLFIAVKNNVDVEAMLEKVGMPGLSKQGEENEIKNQPQQNPQVISADGFVIDDVAAAPPPKQRNRTAELAASSGGAFAVAILLNKALFPVRVPITLGLTPPIYRFLARRKFINSV
ncbi:hypothetical protein P3S67_020225 [Capsicum chacoense]|uniref:uncharacterized protein LOC107840584 n=1 Tax=Capsicum annuum TaxID=4072 RepID=UPI0007BEA828|nr:uncharacterized protein LOC107840584 [Capsicum annuum]KAF3619948.1 Blue copper-like protein [Capsicum annuum]KAF3656001.1 Blue copper-like protein [Capsicum annuum]